MLSEAAFHLQSSAYVLSLIEDELLQVAFDFSDNIAQLRELARRYADHKPDFADLCLVSQAMGARVFKVDFSGLPTVTRILENSLGLDAIERALPLNQPGAPKGH